MAYLIKRLPTNKNFVGCDDDFILVAFGFKPNARLLMKFHVTSTEVTGNFLKKDGNVDLYLTERGQLFFEKPKEKHICLPYMTIVHNRHDLRYALEEDLYF